MESDGAAPVGVHECMFRYTPHKAADLEPPDPPRCGAVHRRPGATATGGEQREAAQKYLARGDACVSRLDTLSAMWLCGSLIV